jgi:hypothetical protein
MVAAQRLPPIKLSAGLSPSVALEGGCHVSAPDHGAYGAPGGGSVTVARLDDEQKTRVADR